MKGKSYSIPLGMVFKKYYCSKCGTKLEKEKTHRVVTKDDKDYYQYHEYGMFPLHDYDVYSYQFKCPSCEERISFDEQCIIERIQKKCSRFVLSPAEIKENYIACRKENNRMKIHRTYSYEKKSQMERLHAYSSHNMELVERSVKCYCFYCKSVFESGEIDSYLVNEKNALCPKCCTDSIIPDSINEAVDESIISEMHDYWF